MKSGLNVKWHMNFDINAYVNFIIQKLNFPAKLNNRLDIHSYQIQHACILSWVNNENKLEIVVEIAESNWRYDFLILKNIKI